MNNKVIIIAAFLGLLILSGCAKEIAPAPDESANGGAVDGDFEAAVDDIGTALDDIQGIDDELDTSDLDELDQDLDLSDI